MKTRGWLKVRKWHYFNGANSLCWRWDHAPDGPVAEDTPVPEEQCATCKRKVEWHVRHDHSGEWTKGANDMNEPNANSGRAVI